MNREELIEEAANAIEKKFESDIHMAQRLYPDIWKIPVAEVAFAVFEKAHAPSTPTDDEREALDNIMRAAGGWWPEAREAILNTFRRTEQEEPVNG